MPNDTHGHHKPEIWSQKCQEIRQPEASEPAHISAEEFKKQKTNNENLPSQ
jgi:hypothetical protein